MDKKSFITEKLREQGYNGPIEGFAQCKRCKGHCCKVSGCICHPVDFEEITKSSILKALDSKKFMITFALKWKEDGSDIDAIPIISAREKGCPENGISITLKHTSCAMLTSTGCSLTFEERPMTGLMLIPVCEDNCKSYMDIPMSEWEMHREVLDSVTKERTGKTTRELFDEIIRDEAYELKRKLQLNVLRNGELLEYGEYIALEALMSLHYYHIHYNPEVADALEEMLPYATIKEL